jgi:hypothetical protein
MFDGTLGYLRATDVKLKRKWCAHRRKLLAGQQLGNKMCLWQQMACTSLMATEPIDGRKRGTVVKRSQSVYGIDIAHVRY